MISCWAEKFAKYITSNMDYEKNDILWLGYALEIIISSLIFSVKKNSAFIKVTRVKNETDRTREKRKNHHGSIRKMAAQPGPVLAFLACFRDSRQMKPGYFRILRHKP